MRATLGRIAAAAALALALVPGPARADGAALVAAASDLKFALEDVARRFADQSGRRVELAFGSSGNFARQLIQGAPFELFLSADEDYVLDLAERGLTVDRGTLYAIGRIVLFVPPGSPIAPDGRLVGLRDALAGERIRRFAIANPEHAPYGRAAREALEHAGLWTAIEPILVLGENVSQAAQFASSGTTAGGIIAYSLALAPTLAERGTFTLLPASWHEPLRQRMVLLADAGPVAHAFYDFVRGAEARAILERYGFALPDGV